ncbi:MAG: universal stress protein [Gaiellales bacterium]|nr:MAG: universal stress protein [Gaiellales bacterium]
MGRKILLGTDGSEPARDAARLAVQLAGSLGLGLTALRVVDVDRYTYDYAEESRSDIAAELENHAKRVLGEVKELADEAGLDTTLEIRQGDSSREIIRFAQDDPDIVMIVLGATGRRRLGRQLIGSTAERVVRQVGRDLPCAVMIAPSAFTNESARLEIKGG